MTADVSVLIATRNRAFLMDSCLAALARSTMAPREIVIVDQSDDDATERLVRGTTISGTELRYERHGGRGKSRAINHAVRLCGGRFLGLTDDDVMVREDWLESFERIRADDPATPVFCGRVLPEPGTDAADYLNLVTDPRPRRIVRSDNPLNTGFCGANVLIDRETFVEVGGYDPRFGPGSPFLTSDDGELAYRLTRAGRPIRYAPELVVYHSGWRKETENRDLHHVYAFGLGAMAGHYLRRGDFRPSAYLLKKLAYKKLMMLGGLVRGRRDRVIDGWVHLTGCPRGLVKGLLTR